MRKQHKNAIVICCDDDEEFGKFEFLCLDVDIDKKGTLWAINSSNLGDSHGTLGKSDGTRHVVACEQEINKIIWLT